MVVAVVVAGALAQILAWSLVAAGRGSVWSTVGPVLGAAGALAVAVEPPPLSGRVPVALAAVGGAAAGAVLYAATAVFVAVVARRWRSFVRHAGAVYRQRADRSGVLLFVGAGAVAVGEELFWRGTAQLEISARLGSALVGSAVTLAAYVAANVPSRNLAIVAGAVVGGAVWGALAWWSAGVLPSVLAHATWTTLMVARPVVGGAR